MNEAGRATDVITDKMESSTSQLPKAKGDLQKMHAIAIKIALDLNEFSMEIDNIASETSDFWKSFYSAFLLFFTLESKDLKRWVFSSNYPDKYVESAIKATGTFNSVSQKIDNLRNSVDGARSNLVQMRGLARLLNKAVGKTDRVLKNYQNVLSRISSDLQNISKLAGELPSLLNDADD